MQKKRLFSVENVLLCDKNNGQCLACVHPIWDALGYLGGQLGPLHMSPVDRAGSVTEMKLVSLHMVIFSPLSEMKNLKKW